MVIFLWIVSLLLMGLGGLLIRLNATNSKLIEFEEQSVGNEMLRERDEILQSIRSMQLSDIRHEASANAGNFYFYRNLVAAGVVLFIGTTLYWYFA